jgi:hypothetical protein
VTGALGSDGVDSEGVVDGEGDALGSDGGEDSEGDVIGSEGRVSS